MITTGFWTWFQRVLASTQGETSECWQFHSLCVFVYLHGYSLYPHHLWPFHCCFSGYHSWQKHHQAVVALGCLQIYCIFWIIGDRDKKYGIFLAHRGRLARGIKAHLFCIFVFFSSYFCTFFWTFWLNVCTFLYYKMIFCKFGKNTT